MYLVADKTGTQVKVERQKEGHYKVIDWPRKASGQRLCFYCTKDVANMDHHSSERKTFGVSIRVKTGKSDFSSTHFYSSRLSQLRADAKKIIFW